MIIQSRLNEDTNIIFNRSNFFYNLKVSWKEKKVKKKYDAIPRFHNATVISSRQSACKFLSKVKSRYLRKEMGLPLGKKDGLKMELRGIQLV